MSENSSQIIRNCQLARPVQHCTRPCCSKH